MILEPTKLKIKEPHLPQVPVTKIIQSLAHKTGEEKLFAAPVEKIEVNPVTANETEIKDTSAKSVSSPDFVPKMVKKQSVTPKTPSTLSKRYVVALIDGVTLKEGPGVKFPEIMAAKKGERLEFVRILNETFIS